MASIFDTWFGAGDPWNTTTQASPALAAISGSAMGAPAGSQTGGYEDPNKNIVNSLAALAKAMQGTPMQPTQPIQMGQAQMLNPVTFQHPQGQVDFSRGPSQWGQGGY